MKLNLFKKILLIALALLVSASVAVSVTMYVAASHLARDLVDEVGTAKLEGDVRSALLYLQRHFGHVRLQDGRLVGQDGQALDGRYDVVDEMQRDLGVVATIFMREGNDFTRVLTNIRTADGKRAVGTRLGQQSAAYEPVRQKKLYIGPAVILGDTYLTAYDPLLDASGELIGIVFIGISQAQTDATIAGGLQRMNQAVLVVFVMLAFGGLSAAWYFARGISRPILSAAGMVNALALGDLRQRLTLKRGDEIGELVQKLNLLADSQKKHSDLAQQIAQGNLDVQVTLSSDQDELGKALQTMTRQLNEVISQIQVAGEQIATGSGQVADASQSLSQGATEQASSLEE
ncbi:HAMP domain-containing protein, partial [Geoalkalibacter ferrihydriticus]